MSVGSGLSATVGIATETTPGTPVAVTRFVEFDSEGLGMKKHTVQGAGLRGGGLVKRAARRALVAREAGGDLSFDAMTNGFGLFLQHMLGSFSATATSIGGGLYQQIHNVGSLQGKAFTTQVLRPDTTGVLGPQAFTYPGCKITGWELSAQQQQQLKVKLTLDALDEATPSNGFATTTLAAASTVGAVSISAVATIPVGSYITIGQGLTAEVVLTGTPTGAGPYAIPVSPALTYAHAIASPAGSATGVNYGAPAALQTASYVAGAGMFTFNGGKLVIGGATTVVSNVWTNTGGVVAGNVRTVSLKGSNPLKVDRWGLGSTIRSEQLENNWRDYSASVEIEYNSRFHYDDYAADVAVALVLSFTAPGGTVLQFYVPVAFQGDIGLQVSGPDILIEKLAFDVLDDGVNGALQAVLTSTDAAV